MRSFESVLGARLIGKEGEVCSSCLYLDDLPQLLERAEKEDLSVQLVEVAECYDFSPDDAIRMTMKYPDYPFCECDALDSADFGQITGNAEMFADHVRERGFHNFDFCFQRILSAEEQDRFFHEGKYQCIFNDKGLDEVVLPERDFEAEKAGFINAIEDRNSKVKTLDVDDIQIKSFSDAEKKELGRYLVKYRTIKFLYHGREYSAVFNMNARVLKPDASSRTLAITTYEENEDFDPKGYQSIEEAFWIEEIIPTTDKLKSKITNLS